MCRSRCRTSPHSLRRPPHPSPLHERSAPYSFVDLYDIPSPSTTTPFWCKLLALSFAKARDVPVSLHDGCFGSHVRVLYHCCISLSHLWQIRTKLRIVVHYEPSIRCLAKIAIWCVVLHNAKHLSMCSSYEHESEAQVVGDVGRTCGSRPNEHQRMFSLKNTRTYAPVHHGNARRRSERYTSMMRR